MKSLRIGPPAGERSSPRTSGLLTRIIAAGGCAGSTAMAPGPVMMPAYARDQRLNRPEAPVTSRSPQLIPRLADYTGRTVIPGLRPEHLLAAAGGPTGPAAWPSAPPAAALPGAGATPTPATGTA